MRPAVFICAVLAVLSATCAEAAERVWRLGLLTLPRTAAEKTEGELVIVGSENTTSSRKFAPL